MCKKCKKRNWSSQRRRQGERLTTSSCPMHAAFPPITAPATHDNPQFTLYLLLTFHKGPPHLPACHRPPLQPQKHVQLPHSPRSPPKSFVRENI
ncbi:hypothetical protein E2C01_096219 [Portunus trituberculatus]|uniref:Uncharacterized protein n=1 Tax=Portunus trituberculatus TaxID=210409 RepID=A0A5B7K1G9_PORTR|nr:hypothetical protein [Portunus trituberculatus]